MLAAFRNEIRLRHQELQDRQLSSLYFGGGTPSLLSVREIGMLVEEVQRYFDFKKEIEITLEANPDDLTDSFLKEIKTIGINRLSIGIQSFF